MLALYRCDRQADALEAYQDARRSLIEGSGWSRAQRCGSWSGDTAQDPALVMPAVEAAELPPELDTGTLLAGREARAGLAARALAASAPRRRPAVLLAGPRGMGKTRLAAELAGELRQDGARVLYMLGRGAPDASGAALARCAQGANADAARGR